MDRLPLDQVLLGDCVEVLQGLPAESVDLVFADPPYEDAEAPRRVLEALDRCERLLAEGNGAQRQSRAHAGGLSIHEVYAATVARANEITGDGRGGESSS